MIDKHKDLIKQTVSSLFQNMREVRNCCGIMESGMENFLYDIVEYGIKPIDFAKELLRRFDYDYKYEKFSGFLFTGATGQSRYIKYLAKMNSIIVPMGVSPKTGSKIIVILLPITNLREFVKSNTTLSKDGSKSV